MPNRNDRNFGRGREMYRSEDRRAGIYGESRFSDRTYDPSRYRDLEDRSSFDRDNANYDRNRDWSRTYDLNQRGHERGSRDYGMGYYGVNSGWRSGAEYGGYGRESDFGSFDRGDDLVYGSPWGRSYGTSINESSSPRRELDRTQGGTMRRRRDYAGRGPKNFQRADERIYDEVCHALEKDPDVDASDIEVEVKGSLVTLRGTVDDRYQKRTAEGIVEYLPGVRDVRNELRLKGSQRE